MPRELPPIAERLLRDRKSLLWVCQRYDLSPGESPHAYDLDPAMAKLRYRPVADPVDISMARQYWEAVWLEGAASPLVDAFRDRPDSDPSASQRMVVELAGSADDMVQVGSAQFLPVWVLPGLIDDRKPLDAQYFKTKRRVREKLAEQFTHRLEDYPGRLLVVIGAEEPDDLKILYDALELLRLFELRMLVIWPEGATEPPTPDNAGVEVLVWQGCIAEFADALKASGAPTDGAILGSAIRIRNLRIVMPITELDAVTRQFTLLADSDLIPPDRFSLEDLHDFLRGDLINWKAYGAGLPVQRSYRSLEGLSLTELVINSLEGIAAQGVSGHQLTKVIELPSVGGSGATTLIRSAAYEAAGRGYPVLILRPEQTSIDIEELSAFVLALSDLSLSQGLDDFPPVLIVLDAEHWILARDLQLAPHLASRGRRAVILQVVPYEEGHNERELQRPRHHRLIPLRPSADELETAACQQTFHEIVDRFLLPISVPTTNEWHNYRAATWETPDGSEESPSSFWVALEFFLTHGMDFTDAERARDALGEWIDRRIEQIDDPSMYQMIQFIAVLSSFRIVCPLWTALRPLTGGAISSETVQALRQLQDLIDWKVSRHLNDQVLRFIHPQFARELLRRQGIRQNIDRIRAIEPMLRHLSAGHPGDQWVAESLSLSISPSYEARQGVSPTDWDWRLSTFESLPPAIRERNKVILHHWARCLYQSTDLPVARDLPLSTRRKRLETAIEKLRSAIDIPRRDGRDEVASHLLNTLGTACYRYANFLEEELASKAEVNRAWNEACNAFEEAIAESGGGNIPAYLAYSRRLIRHARDHAPNAGSANQDEAANVIRAMGLLDDVEELIETAANPDPDWEISLEEDRSEALRWLNVYSAHQHVEDLKASNPELGYYCEARLLLGDSKNPADMQRALAVFDEADRVGVALGPRVLLFQLFLIRKDPRSCFDFDRQLLLYRTLERTPNFKARPIDLFRHAVLCYQTGEPREGSDRFRRLRELKRRSDFVPPRVREVLLDHRDPPHPRIVAMRVLRRITDWRAEGFVDELEQKVPFRPRHFSPPPPEKKIVACIIRFEFDGPLAVPERFEDRRTNFSAAPPS